MTLVTDLWSGAGGAPEGGRLIIQPAISAVNQSDPARVVTTLPITVDLDAAGATSFEVTDSYDPGWMLADGQPMPYQVTERFASGIRSYLVILTGDATHLRDLQPLPSMPELVPVPVPGPQGEVAVDSTVTGAAGTQALVEDLDPSPNRALLKFTIPKGDKGEQAEIEVGSTATGAPGSQAAVTDSDPSPHKSVLEFTIPKGDKGDQGEVAVDSTVTGAPGTEAQVEDLDPSPNRALLKFTIPRGDVGATGPAIGGILTTKGDLVARDATTAVRVPVGSQWGMILTPDATAAAGVAWAAPWETVTLWADLPTYTTRPLGHKIHVTSGLGVCVALRGPTGWVVAPESDTGPLRITQFDNGWTDSTSNYPSLLRRQGDVCRLQLSVQRPATFTPIILNAMPVGFGTPGQFIYKTFAMVSNSAYNPQTGAHIAVFPHSTSSAVAWYGTAPSTSSQFLADAVWTLRAGDDLWPTTPPA